MLPCVLCVSGGAPYYRGRPAWACGSAGTAKGLLRLHCHVKRLKKVPPCSCPLALGQGLCEGDVYKNSVPRGRAAGPGAPRGAGACLASPGKGVPPRLQGSLYDACSASACVLGPSRGRPHSHAALGCWGIPTPYPPVCVCVCVCVTPNHFNKIQSVRYHTAPL